MATAPLGAGSLCARGGLTSLPHVPNVTRMTPGHPPFACSKLLRRLCLSGVAGLFMVARLSATMPNLDLDSDGVVDFRQSTQGSPIPGFGGVGASFEALRTVNPENAVSAALAEGALVQPGVAWGGMTASTGYFGLRFRSSRGVHHGWVELQNPVINGRPAFESGGWATRVFYNPDPGQPIRVGDTSVRLRAAVDPASGQLRLFVNCDASSFPNGLVIQSRPATGPGNWTPVATLMNGSMVTIPMDSSARLFRVVY